MAHPSSTTGESRTRGADAMLAWAMGLSAATAVGLLIAQRGFVDPLARTGLVETGQLAAIAIFVACKLATIRLAADRAVYVKERWFDFALAGLAAACVVLDLLPMRFGRVEAWGHVGVETIAILQVYVLMEAGAGGQLHLHSALDIIVGEALRQRPE